MAYREQIPNPRGVALYGKIPVAPDYVIVNLTDPVSLALSDWIDRGFQDLAASGLRFPPFMVRFIFTSPSLSTAAVGVLAPSHDQVGRQFPIAIFHTLPVSSLADSLAAIPVSYASFLNDVSLVLTDLTTLTQTELFERYSGLLPPTPEAVAEGRQETGVALAEAGAEDFASRLFGDLNQRRQNYAYNTFITAALEAAKNPAANSPTVLECPVAVDIDLLAWIDLAQRILGWREQAPSCFWAVEPIPRLLIALGTAPKQIVRYLADPSYSSTKLWPLLTDHPDAIANATAALNQVGVEVETCANRSISDLFNLLQRHVSA